MKITRDDVCMAVMAVTFTAGLLIIGRMEYLEQEQYKKSLAEEEAAFAERVALMRERAQAEYRSAISYGKEGN